MTRPINKRLVLRGTLVTSTPISVGGYGDDTETDLPLARDGSGRWYVPGTSLAGVLRAYLQRAIDPKLVYLFFGYQRLPSEIKTPKTAVDDSASNHSDTDEQRRATDELLRCLTGPGIASHVFIEDATILNYEEIQEELRDHVGIDRFTGAAAPHIKYDRAILPRGTRLSFCLTIEIPPSCNEALALGILALIKEGLEQRKIRLGAAKTRGLGQVKLEEAEILQQSFNKRHEILELLLQRSQIRQRRLPTPLTGGTPVPANTLLQARQSVPAQGGSRLIITIHWKPIGPLMVKAGYDGLVADVIPLTSGVNGQVAPVLPGSSVKGALRHRAELIVRTLLRHYQPCWLNLPSRERFLHAIEVPLVLDLFGSPHRSQKPSRNGAAHATPGAAQPTTCPHCGRALSTAKTTSQRNRLSPGQGALIIQDTYGTPTTRENWRAMERALSTDELLQVLDSADWKCWSLDYHVAIDRWLGSAAESMLYTVLEPHCIDWAHLVLEIDLERLPHVDCTCRHLEPLGLAALALLMLLLRDLTRGYIPLGYGTHRGLGSIEVTKIEFTGESLPQSLSSFANYCLEGNQLSRFILPTSVAKLLSDALRTWLKTMCS
ncbi:MAG: hypothetical protein KatS3mg113_1048 [Planctomycetaceae bacterium]|nr:MAG: hypothetical protein KatS3mg113_1048 [Planctomycetaceae bacterium]